MRSLVCALGLLLLITSCGSGPEDPTEPAVPEPAKHAPAPRPADRDEEAVLTTLANTNPCLLVDAAQQKAAFLARPHECELEMSRGDGQILFVGRNAHSLRYLLPTKVVDGVRVDTVNERGRDCAMDVPVSFALAIRVSASSDVRPCEAASRLVATVVGRADRIGENAHEDAMPDLKKQACTVLDGAITAAGLGTTTPVPTGSSNHLDGCEVDVGKVKNLRLELRANPDPGKQGWTKSATIAGRTIYRKPGSCGWAWSEGPLDHGNVRMITLGSDDCPADLPAKLVPALVAELGKPAAPSGVDRLTILASRPGEPNPGACVDYPADTCEPAQGVALPGGAGSKTAAAAVDPHVACALAAKAVIGQFPGMRPVIDTQKSACAFVEPTHSLVIEVPVTAGETTFAFDASAKQLTVAGHPGRYGEDGDRAAVCVDSGFHGERQTGNWNWCVVATGTAAPTAKTKLEPAMDAFAQEHLR